MRKVLWIGIVAFMAAAVTQANVVTTIDDGGAKDITHDLGTFSSFDMQALITTTADLTLAGVLDAEGIPSGSGDFSKETGALSDKISGAGRYGRGDGIALTTAASGVQFGFLESTETWTPDAGLTHFGLITSSTTTRDILTVTVTYSDTTTEGATGVTGQTDWMGFHKDGETITSIKLDDNNQSTSYTWANYDDVSLVFDAYLNASGALAMELIDPATTVTGSVELTYGTVSNDLEIIDIVVSDESHGVGSFNVLSTSPATLASTNAGTSTLEVEFDNSVAGLTVNGSSATGLVTVTWTETGSGVTNNTVVPVSACSLSFADTIPPANSNIRYVGRFNMSDPLAPRMYWSGTHIIAWFEGTSCQVKLNCEGGNDFFNIIIDNGTPVKYDLAVGAQTITAASGLADGFHKIEVFKRTSYRKDNTAFEGFITDTGKGLALLPPEPALKIQFYGDSITDGHSVDASSDNVSAIYWNNYLTDAALTARNLNMQYVCTAASGIAVIHPWSTGFIMDNYYDRIVPGGGSDSSNEWDFSNDDPDIVVINLFQNDSWVNRSPHNATERNAIIDAYEDLLVNIRAAHTNAEMICALGNMDATRSGSVWPGYIDTAVSRMNDNHGDSKVYSLFFPYKETGGHPIAAEQLPMANALTTYIQTNFSYLFDRDSDGDGFTDVDEVDLGTDPDDPTSYFSLRGDLVTPSAEQMQLVWPSRIGVSYRIWESSTLTNWVIARNWSVAQTPPEDSFEADLTTSDGFFKIEAERP